MPQDTLKGRALELLCEVVATNAEAASVGRPYGEICQLLDAEFPDHKWDRRISLRWYANKIGAGEFAGHELPNIRPTTRWSEMNSLPPDSRDGKKHQ